MNTGRLLSKNEKQLITVLTKYHQTGQVCLDNTDFVHGHTICELAGFYGVGGRMYQYDRITRETALKTLNYSLLKKLNVDYILFNSSDFAKLNQEAKEKLADNKYFEKFNIDTPGFHFYRFHKVKVSVQSQILGINWIQGCRKGKEFIVINKTRMQQSESEMKGLASKIAKKDKVCAYWLSQQAVSE